MVTYADKSMQPQLVTLWQQSFGDSPDYIGMFLDWNFDRIKTIVYVTEDDASKPVSVAYLLPVTYVLSNRSATDEISCWYLYAAATLPEYRGHGYFGDILTFIEENIPEPVILVPGERSLISFYEKRGLHVWLEERRKDICQNISESIDEGTEERKKEVLAGISDISTDEYIKIRRDILAELSAGKQAGYVTWDEQFMKYICHENQYCGGAIKQITIADKQFLVMYRTEKQVLKVLELVPHTHVDECIKSLQSYLNAREPHGQDAIYQTAEVMLQPTVMASSRFKADRNAGYFNLIMA